MAAGLRRSTSVVVDLALFLCVFGFPVFFAGLGLLDLDFLDLGGFEENKKCFLQFRFDFPMMTEQFAKVLIVINGELNSKIYFTIVKDQVTSSVTRLFLNL